MSIERVREYVKQWNADERILEFDVSSATVELAAQALHCEPAHIAAHRSEHAVHEVFHSYSSPFSITDLNGTPATISSVPPLPGLY